MGLNHTPSTKQIAGYFSKKYTAYKTAMTDGSSLIYNTRQLIAAHEQVIKLNRLLDSRDELVAVSYPLERSMYGNTIKDSIDLILLKHPEKGSQFVEIVYFDTSERLVSEKDLGILLRANLGYGVVLRELANNIVDVRCTVLNLMTGHKTNITLAKDQRINYRRLLKNLMTAVDQELYYPRASNSACGHCKWNSICSWKVT